MISAPPSRPTSRVCICVMSGKSASISKTSSHVTTLRSGGTSRSRQLTRVVFPAPGAPATITERSRRMASRSRAADGGVSVPRSTSSSSPVAVTTNFRIWMLRRFGCVTGGPVMWTRDPSASCADTMGDERSSRLPVPASSWSAKRRSAEMSETIGTSSLMPLRTTNVRCPPMTMISSTVGSSRSSPRNPSRWGGAVTVTRVSSATRVIASDGHPDVSPQAKRPE